MAFCSKCGEKLDDGVKFCQKCGAPVDGAETKQQNHQNQQNQKGGFEAVFNTPDTTSEYDPKDVSDNKGLSVLAYIGILVLIPIFAAKNSKFARFHSNQGLVLLIADVAVSIVSGILNAIFGGIIVLGTIVSIVCSLAGLALLALAILGIVNAAQGKAKELPLIGSIKLLK